MVGLFKDNLHLQGLFTKRIVHFVPVMPVFTFFMEKMMNRGSETYRNIQQHIDSNDIPLLALAALYGELRRTPGVWKSLLVDLLVLPGYSLARIAQVIEMVPRSITRLIYGETDNPGFVPGFKIMLIHLNHYGEKYTMRQNSCQESQTLMVE